MGKRCQDIVKAQKLGLERADTFIKEAKVCDKWLMK